MRYSFKTFIAEAIASSSMDKAASLISAYLHKHIQSPVIHMPEPEGYHGSNGAGFGIRFFIPKGNKSLRLNWSAEGNVGNTSSLSSADVWLSGDEHYHFAFQGDESLVKTLPFIVSILDGKESPKTGTHIIVPEDNLAESYIVENAEANEIFDGILEMLPQSGFNKSAVWKQYKGAGMKVFDSMVAASNGAIVKDGTKFSFVGGNKGIQYLSANRTSILSDAGSIKVTVTKSASKETYAVSPKIEELEAQHERLSYEDQLGDLENLIKLTVNGSSNALFIAGRGGIGKTHTVEKVLADLGLQDGRGYFKNTGSASAAGIYSLLFKYRDSVILFDDSDDALGDQEARNIFKAATDTKKTRKLVWNKMGKNVVDPDSMTDEEMLDQGLIPRFFEFTGKIIFISNLPINKLDPDGAIRTRAYMIDINPTDVEVYAFMEKIADHIPLQDGLSLSNKERLHVIHLLKTGNSKQSANLRKLSRGFSMAAASKGSIADNQLERMIRAYA